MFQLCTIKFTQNFKLLIISNDISKKSFSTHLLLAERAPQRGSIIRNMSSLTYSCGVQTKAPVGSSPVAWHIGSKTSRERTEKSRGGDTPLTSIAPTGP